MKKEPSAPKDLPDPAQWVDLYGDYLFRYAMLRLGNRDLVEDMVQETLLAALRGRDQFAGRSSPRSWFVAILKRKISDHFRSKKRRDASRDLESMEKLLNKLFDQGGKWRVEVRKWGADPSAALEQREFWDVLHSCLAKLPTALADAFKLKELLQVGNREIRRMLNVSESNLRVMFHRARLQLARCLQIKWFQDDEE